MTENEKIWAHDSLDVDDEGYVTGAAYTYTFGDGFDVQVGVTSYEYERGGETKMNHVPNVVVTDKDGSIVREPHAWDSEHPNRAIENGKGVAEDVFKRPGQYDLE